MARLLGPTALGIWVILSMIPSYAEAFGRIKTDVAAVYFIGQKTFRREEILANLNLIAIISATVVLSIIIWQFDPIYEWLFQNDSGDHRSKLVLLLFQIPINFLYLNYTYFHIAHENIFVYNRMVVINALSNSIIVIGLITLTEFGLWSVIIGLIVAPLMSLIYGSFSIDRENWTRVFPCKEVTIALLRYGIHFYLGGILGQLQQSGTHFIAVVYLLPAQMAFLSQGQGVGMMLNNIVKPISTILFPRVSSLDKSQAVQISCNAFRVSCILMLTSGFLLAIFAEHLIVLLYGSDFRSTASVIRFLMPGLVIMGVCGTLTNYFSGIGKASIIPKIQIIPVMLQLLLAWVLMQSWGINGAAAAISIGGIFYGLLTLLVFINMSGASYRMLIPCSSDFLFIKNFAIKRFDRYLN